MKKMHEIKNDGSNVTSIDGLSVGSGGSGLQIIEGTNLGGWEDGDYVPIADETVIAQLNAAANGTPSFFKGSVIVPDPDEEPTTISGFGFLAYFSDSDSLVVLFGADSALNIAFVNDGDDTWHVEGSNGW